MVKTRIFTENIKKTEKWIQQFLEKGYRLKEVEVNWGKFHFEETEDKRNGNQVRIDYRTFQSQEDFADYVALFEDSGWRHAGGTKSSGMQYFERCSEQAGEDIFSDKVSRADRYKRVSYKWLLLALGYAPVLYVFCVTGICKIPNLVNWKEWYYTPGLWEASGSRFLGMFLFETPFVIGRNFGGVLFLFLIAGYLFFGVKALYWYCRERR